MDVNSLASINMVFARIESLRELLVKRKFYATTKEEFDAYSEVYNTLLVSEYMESSFKKKDGTQANTFADMLGDLNETLYIRYEEMEVSEASTEAIDMEIETVLNLLRQTVSGLDYIDMCASSASSSLISHLFKLMDFFKSAKAELTGFTIAYDLGARGEAVVKLFSKFVPITKYNYVVPQFDMIDVLTDELHLVREQFWHRWKFYLDDWWKWEHEHVHIDIPMPIIFRFILAVSEIYKYKSVTHIHDIIQKVSHEYFIKEKLELLESVSLIYEKIYYDVIETLINDSFEYLTSMIHQCADIAHYYYKSDFRFDDKFWYQLFRKLYKEPFIMESSIEQFNDDSIKIQESSFGLSDRLILVYEQIITELEYLEPIPDKNDDDETGGTDSNE